MQAGWLTGPFHTILTLSRNTVVIAIGLDIEMDITPILIPGVIKAVAPPRVSGLVVARIDNHDRDHRRRRNGRVVCIHPCGHEIVADAA